MGLFGGSKTVVGTSVSRVLDEKQYPDTIKSAVIGSIFEGGSMSDTILEDMLNGPGLKVDRYYRYARDHYLYGLPNQEYVNAGSGANAAKEYLQSLYSNPLSFEYVRLEALDYTHVGWQHLYDEYDYDYATNKIRSLSTEDTPVYLDNIKAYYVLPPVDEPEDLNNNYANGGASFSPSPTQGYTQERRTQDIRELQQQSLSTDYEILDSGEDHVRIFYVYEAEEELQREFFDVSLADYDTDANYIHAMFHEAVGEETITRFFTYRKGEGSHPTLDDIANPEYKPIGDPSYVNTGRFFPFLFFRKHNINLAGPDEQGRERYKAASRMAKLLNLDFQEFSDAIHENPDIDNVRHAVLMLAVPANSNDPYELKYLFDFFKRVHQQDRDNGDVSGELFAGSNGLFPARRKAYVPKAVTIQDAGFKMALGFQEVTSRLRTGKLGKVGSVHRKQGHQSVSQVVNTYDEFGIPTGTKIAEHEYPYQQYCKQINSLFYEEITVLNLTLRYDVYKDYDVVANAHSSKLLVPIDRDITQKYSLIEREHIYFRSMHMVYNSKVTKDVKWYESSFFQFVLIVAAIAITIWSGGVGSPALAAAVSLGFYGLAAAIILVHVVVFAVKAYVFRLVVKELGIENSFAVAMALAVLSMGTGITGTNIGFLPSANNLMSVVTNLTSAIQKQTQSLLSDYNNESQSFELLKEKKNEELEEAMALLETNDFLDPFMFIGQEPMEIIGESPDDFYNRTIHAGNTGPLIFKSIESYVDISLTLPSTHSSIGDTIYGI